MTAQALIGLGNARYQETNKTREHWYLAALDTLRKYRDTNLKAQALIVLGNAARPEKKYQKAIHYYNQAIEINPPQELKNKACQGIKIAQSFISGSTKSFK
ncbi:MAG: tetratricopeptide repeat protein [Candidatus Amoebophilus sp.]